VKNALERATLPDADAARNRARDVVLAAFAAREPVRRTTGGRSTAVGVAVAALVALLTVASPPGMAVVDRVREVVGVERAQPALFSLPTGGRLLVTTGSGVWVVEANGSKRLLSGYGDAGWSPFGRFVVATRDDEVAALEPTGNVHWTLARPGTHGARWGGSRTDTRIAYVDRTGVRLVAGDGTGDHLLAGDGRWPLAWRPGNGHVLAYVTPSGLRVQDVDTGRVPVRARVRLRTALHTKLAWSSDGRRVLVVNAGAVHVFGPRGNLVARGGPSPGAVVDAAFRPGTHDVLVARTEGGQSTVSDLRTSHAVFSGTGVFDAITPSPDGRWLLVEWRTADQWVFVRLTGPKAIRAVSGIAAQFRGKPVVAGWCCAG
jgi:hypothetical protein